MSIIMQANDISIAFGGIKAVQNVSFGIEKGEVLGLIGPNGSGKSTCVNIISGVYKQDSGDVIFGGRTLTHKQDLTERSRLGMGRTFQSPKPFGNLTVYQNVFTISLQKCSPADAHKKTEDVLKLSQLMPLKDVLAEKLPIEKRKWLDLARILATDPTLIMMDEVMAGLNPSEMEGSLELVRHISAQGVTILFIEHVMKAVLNICSRVIVLNEGRLLCEGEPNEVLRRKEVVEAYLGGGAQKYAKN